MTGLRPVLEIGGTHACGGLVDLAARRIIPATRRRMPLDADSTADAIIDVIVRCATLLDAPRDLPWGVAIPGPFDYERGIALLRGQGKFEALHGMDLGKLLRERIPARPSAMAFINDANAFVLGEWIAGAAAGHERVVGITLGTGIGSAFLANGTIVEHDPRVPPEGRVDLLSYADRPLEETVSRRAIRAAYLRQRDPADEDATIDVRDIAHRARAGDATAGRAIADAFTALGEALAPWLRAFAPSGLVVGGSMAASWDLIGGRIRAGIARVEPRLLDTLDLVTARLPDDAALLGAAWHASRATPARPVGTS